MELTKPPSKFNMTAIITAKDTITDNELKHFILDNLSTFDKGSKFTIFCGHHHCGPTDEKPTLENIHLAESDPILSYNHHMVYNIHTGCTVHVVQIKFDYIYFFIIEKNPENIWFE